MADSPREAKLTLYSSPVSDCSARLRIALSLKKLPYKLISTQMNLEQNRTSEYTKMNPAQTVPTLVVQMNGKSDVVLTQSLAALDFLEEAFPYLPTLYPPPTEFATRAHVRTLMQIIATDTHPLTTPRVRRAYNSALSLDPELDNTTWVAAWIRAGLKKYDDAIRGSSGKYSVGDTLTMADVVLIPELWTAERAGVNVDEFENVRRVFKNLMLVDQIASEYSTPESR